jgi:hypothetical protein
MQQRLVTIIVNLCDANVEQLNHSSTHKRRAAHTQIVLDGQRKMAMSGMSFADDDEMESADEDDATTPPKPLRDSIDIGTDVDNAVRQAIEFYEMTHDSDYESVADMASLFDVDVDNDDVQEIELTPIDDAIVVACTREEVRIRNCARDILHGYPDDLASFNGIIRRTSSGGQQLCPSAAIIHLCEANSTKGWFVDLLNLLENYDEHRFMYIGWIGQHSFPASAAGQLLFDFYLARFRERVAAERNQVGALLQLCMLCRRHAVCHPVFGGDDPGSHYFYLNHGVDRVLHSLSIHYLRKDSSFVRAYVQHVTLAEITLAMKILACTTYRVSPRYPFDVEYWLKRFQFQGFTVDLQHIWISRVMRMSVRVKLNATLDGHIFTIAVLKQSPFSINGHVDANLVAHAGNESFKFTVSGFAIPARFQDEAQQDAWSADAHGYIERGALMDSAHITLNKDYVNLGASLPPLKNKSRTPKTGESAIVATPMKEKQKRRNK